MNSQKKIEINQSSLLGLKAELLRKKSEVSTAKYSQEINPPKIKKKKLVTKLDKANEGVIERDKRDAEEIQEELDELKKSQKVLEAKAKLYDNLVNDPGGTSNSNIDISGFLVDFKQKCQDEPPKEEAEEKEEAESDSCYNNGEYSDEDEWVDFVDCLGRTKRCHRDDLEEMKKQDEKLNKSLHGDGEKKENTSINEKANEAELPQLCSEDMKREIMRQKWEEQERNLIDKKNVHYQDILFDEARTHGVAYYEFSTDEAERARQQEELKNLRKETENQQAATLAAAQKKQRLMEERLKAARRRKRERLGLPLDEEEPEEVKEEEKKPEPPEELRRDVRKATTVRPWDIGKDNTPKIMTQEEWVEKKRSERIQEFAPPPSQEPRKTIQKKRRYQEYREEEPVKMEPVPIVDELDQGQEEVRGRGVEIAPPPTFEMYGPSSKPRQSHMRPNQTSIDKSIEEGLNFLRRQVEEKQKKKRRDESIEII